MLSSIALIPDGNRRFARKSGLSLVEAYQAGFDKAREAVTWSLDYPELKAVTIYTLSTENLTRSSAELSIFTDLLRTRLQGLLSNQELFDRGVRVRVIGDRSLLSPALCAATEELEKATAENKEIDLNLAIGYGGRTEIVQAARRVVDAGLPLTEENITNQLYTGTEPDLVIRTGDTQRMSGFLTWQSVYSELYFSKKLWPEFSKADFDEAVADYESRQRRFGK